MNRENQVIFGLWITALQLMTGTGAFKVQLQPKKVMRHVNESLELVCMVVDCPHKPTFTWKTTSDISVSGTKEVNRTTSRKVYNHLTTEDEVTVICMVNCEGTYQEKTVINVYSFPTDPVIFRKDNSTLACTVLRVYPCHHFQLFWLHGDTVLSESTFDCAEGVQDISSVYTPNVEYLGKNITCRVTLDLNGVPEDRRVRSVTVQYGPSFVKVSSNTTVKLGERLELRCDTDGNANTTWWKIGRSEVTPLGRNKVLVIENATWSSAGEYECEASNELASRRSKVGVTLQGPPNIPKLRLSQGANPRAGDNVTITCNSDISILSGRLSISGGSLNVEGEKESSSVSINIPSVQLKDSGLYYCKAQNEFGSTKSNISISVLAPPRNSTVLVHPSSQVMEDQNITVHCRTVSFPAASITLTRKADGVEFRSPNGTFHLLNLKSVDKGTYVVNFTNELGYEVQTFELIVKAPPRNSTVLVHPSSQVMEDQNITVHCRTVSFPAASITLTRKADGVEFRSPNGTFHLLNLKSVDKGTYVVNFTNELGYEVQTFELIVKAPPRNSTVLVHPSSQVMEDQNITVHCRTVSFPAASITLTRKADGVEFRSPNGTFHLLNLKSEDKGTYVVNFTNELGYEVQTFEVIVKERQTITPILTKTLVPAVSSMSLLTAGALLVRHLRRAKKGSSEYNMSEALGL